MNVIKKLIELSPCKVIFGQWLDVYYGAYDYSNFSAGVQKTEIQIEVNHPIHEQIAVLAHELGHALCAQKGCKCRLKHKEYGSMIITDEVLTEYHAFKYALTWLLKHKQKKSLQWVMPFMGKEWGPHLIAVRKVKKLKLWEKCKRFIEEEEDEK